MATTEPIRPQAAPEAGTATVVWVWHGAAMVVRTTSWPQGHANIVGRIIDPDGVVSAVYSLNGGDWIPMGLGPNGRRLVAAGDFNIDVAVASLRIGPNAVRIRVTDGLGNQRERTVGFSAVSGSRVTLPFVSNWAAGLGTSTVADGRWRFSNAGARTLSLGYDRLLVVGDTTWTDYDALVPITFHRAVAPGPVSGTPGLGVMVNWNGHNNTVTPGSQPLQGFKPASGGPTPFGAIMWWRMGPTEIISHRVRTVAIGPVVAMPAGVRFLLRVQVDRLGLSTSYRARLWRTGTSEPMSWQVQWTSPGTSDEPRSGSLVLLAHELDATFGNVVVTPLA